MLKEGDADLHRGKPYPRSMATMLWFNGKRRIFKENPVSGKRILSICSRGIIAWFDGHPASFPEK